MYASLEDISAWLRDDRVTINDANTKQPNIDAGRIIRSRLSGVFAPAVLSTWDSPDDTPELVRSIAGRLTAAYVLRGYNSTEGNPEIAAYATQLWNDSMQMLSDIIMGTQTVVDDNNNPIDTTGENLLGFWPDNTTNPLFSVSDVFS